MLPMILAMILLQFNPSSNAIINGTYYNISSMSGVFQVTNASSGGLEEVFIMLMIFFVLVGSSMLGGRISPVLSVFGSSIIMVIISLIAQSVFLTSGGQIGQLLPVVFLAVSIITGMMSLLGNFLSPYG